MATGPITWDIEVTDLGPGDTTAASFVGGTASCDPDLGYSLPAGDYEYRILVTAPRAPEVDDMTLVGFWSEPFPLTVE